MNWREKAGIVEMSDVSIGTYYSFFMSETNKGDNLRNYAPVFDFKVIEVCNDEYCTPTKVEITGKENITPALKIKLEKDYLVQFHGMSCEYFKTREDAEKFHDERLKEYFSEFSAKNKEQHKNKFYKALVSKIEKDSLKFYDGLTKTQKKYIQWLSNNKTF